MSSEVALLSAADCSGIQQSVAFNQPLLKSSLFLPCQSARHFRQPPPLPLGTPRWRRRVRATEPLWGRTALGAAAWRPRRTAAAGDRERRKERRRRPARRAERRGEARAGPRGRKRRRNLPLPRPAGRASHPATINC